MPLFACMLNRQREHRVDEIGSITRGTGIHSVAVSTKLGLTNALGPLGDRAILPDVRGSCPNGGAQ